MIYVLVEYFAIILYAWYFSMSEVQTYTEDPPCNSTSADRRRILCRQAAKLKVQKTKWILITFGIRTEQPV